MRSRRTTTSPVNPALIEDAAMHQEIRTLIEENKQAYLDFVAELIRHATPNPPGNTRDAMGFIKALLDQEDAPYEIVQRDETMPNLVAHTTFGEGDKHLVLNGHIDVCPVG